MNDLKKIIYRKTSRSTEKSYEVDSDMLELLIAIDGAKSVQQVAHEVSMSPSVFKATFLKLVKKGMIEKVEVTEPTVNKTFIKSIKELLIRFVGPIGDVLVDGTAEDMGFNADNIPLSSVANFIENLAREIPGENERNTFKEKMIREMRNIGA